ncbi:MAG: hypothetical protein Q9160_006289 [Pyrenula sp. 1 TL-2023]
MDFRNGMNHVYSPPPSIAPVASVIFVHGLFGGPWKTFAAKTKGGNQKKTMYENNSSTSSLSSAQNNTKVAGRRKEAFWPRDLLTQVVDNVTVYTYGYDANVERFMGAAGLNTVHEHGRNLLNALSTLLETWTQDDPIVFVAHSLGGLVVKEALNQSASTIDSSRKKVLPRTCGIIFLGTPHKGSKAASYGQILFRMTQIFALQSVNTKLMAALQKNSETFDRISTAFYETLEQNEQLRVWSFIEEQEILRFILGTRIVPPDSARIGHVKENWGPISADHRNIAKYANTDDDGLHDEAAGLRVHEVDQVYAHDKKSFEWLFTDETQFSRWLSDGNGLWDPIFWITGKPGSGKSTLMRFALEHLRTKNTLPDSIGEPIAYFFHLRGKAYVQKSLYGMLRELVFGVLKQFEPFFELIRPAFQRVRNECGTVRWNVSSLKEMLLEIPHLQSPTPGRRDRIVLFIDALDENEDQKDNDTMISILKCLCSSHNDTRQKSNSPVLKLCLASRPWPIFQRELGTNSRIPSFAIHDFTGNDIRSYSVSLLKRPVSQSEVVNEPQRAIRTLSEDITTKARGVFVWVRIVVDNLRQQIVDGTPIESLRKIILGYPEELKDFYKYTISRIPPNYCRET